MEMEKNNKRLYVLSNRSLGPVYACVQSGHAVAQWLLEHPEQDWNNSYLIYLKANINYWKQKLDREGIEYSEFREPDLGDKVTAIATLNDGEIFKHLKTVRVREAL